MTAIGTFLYTLFKGRQVGKDQFGNVYYEAKSEITATGHKKRWVIYNGLAEATKIPPHWHGWMHYTTDFLPSDATNLTGETQTPQYKWMKEPLPNLTGTALAYVPAGHVNRGAERAATTADYTAWKP